MMKRNYFFSLMAVLAICLFPGCNGSGEPENDETEEQEASIETVVSETTAPAGEANTIIKTVDTEEEPPAGEDEGTESKETVDNVYLWEFSIPNIFDVFTRLYRN